MRPATSSGRWAAGSFLRRASKAHPREQYFVWHEYAPLLYIFFLNGFSQQRQT
jgi:hypothetical protein